jgi:hypothetical protein
MRIERGGVSAPGVIEQIGLVLALGLSVLAAVVSAPGRGRVIRFEALLLA